MADSRTGSNTKLGIGRKVTRRSAVAVGVTLIAAILLLAWGHARADIARAAEPGMSLSIGGEESCDAIGCRVDPDQPFTITVNADPAPDVELLGFAAELLFPGLEYIGSDDCEAEVHVGRVDGEPLALCLSIETGSGGRGISIGTEVNLPPLEPLDLPLGASGVPLATFDFTCTEMGSQTVTLTANPPSGQGAQYADSATASPIPLVTVDGAADTFIVHCGEPTIFPPVTSPVTGVGGSPADGEGGASVGIWVLIGLVLAMGAGVSLIGLRYAPSR